ncbi:MAG: amidohydrolase family protein [Alphaproteobacteria bacterium]|nr:amidohydrolase family protein [Alphaproteobacteria bacterium]
MKHFLAVVFCALLAGASRLPAGAQDIVIHAGHVMAVPGEGWQTRRSILIDGETVSGLREGYVSPDGAQIIDLKEAYVLPGLIDSHVHLLSTKPPRDRLDTFTKTTSDVTLDGVVHARDTLLAGFTAVQDVGGTDEAIFALRDGVAAGKLAGPHIRASGRAVAVTGGHGDINGFAPRYMAMMVGDNICNGADDCRRATRQQIKQGADIIKITATGGVLSNTDAGLEKQFSDAELAAIVEAAESMGRKVTAHAHGKSGIDAALRAGVHSIEHGTYLDDETIALFLEHEAVLVPTVLAGVTVTGWTDEPWLPKASREKAEIVGPRMLEMLRLAREGGVRVAFGTDTGVSAHGKNAKEFALMVEAGFSPEEAIRSATVTASEHIEMSDRIGTLEAGKLADLIATQGNPLENIAELEDVDFVMKGGQVYKPARGPDSR